MDNYFTIGKAARQININPRTLRFYEQVGLICPSNRSQTGYRLYSPSDIEKLKFIIRAKDFGLTLEEIKSILSLTEEGLCLSVKQHVGELLTLKITEIEGRIKDLQSLKEDFTKLRSSLENKENHHSTPHASCSCLE
jgi:DNA-binding transcriptional MerR regulator